MGLLRTADDDGFNHWYHASTTTTGGATVTYINGERQHSCAFADRELERLDLENARLRMVVKRLRERLANGG